MVAPIVAAAAAGKAQEAAAVLKDPIISVHMPARRRTRRTKRGETEEIDPEVTVSITPLAVIVGGIVGAGALVATGQVVMQARLPGPTGGAGGLNIGPKKGSWLAKVAGVSVDPEGGDLLDPDGIDPVSALSPITAAQQYAYGQVLGVYPPGWAVALGPAAVAAWWASTGMAEVKRREKEIAEQVKRDEADLGKLQNLIHPVYGTV